MRVKTLTAMALLVGLVLGLMSSAASCWPPRSS
jgi:hypothetical protein